MSKARGVDDEFSPDHGVVVREGDTRNFALLCHLHDLFGCHAEASRLVEFRLADTPVLAEAATQIAARRAKTQNLASWQEMIQRLLLYGIDCKTIRRAVPEGIKRATDVFADVTKPRLPFSDTAQARAEGAKNLAIGRRVPPQGLFHRETIALLLARGKGCPQPFCLQFCCVVLY